MSDGKICNMSTGSKIYVGRKGPCQKMIILKLSKELAEVIHLLNCHRCWKNISLHMPLFVYIYIYIYIYMCVCVCVCVEWRSLYIYIYIITPVCVCVCRMKFIIYIYIYIYIYYTFQVCFIEDKETHHLLRQPSHLVENTKLSSKTNYKKKTWKFIKWKRLTINKIT